MKCPLCNSNSVLFQSPPFFRCDTCLLIFKDPTVHLKREEEKKRYSTHENTIDNSGYVAFLSPVVDEVKRHCATGTRGLDYGCGPGPVLATLLNREGFQVTHYDPHFFPNMPQKSKDLDFITCTEAAEHFCNPGQEFQTMFSMLSKNGVLVVMTELYREGMILKDWYYPRDPTHVCFYSSETLQWIARCYSAELITSRARIATYHLQLSR